MGKPIVVGVDGSDGAGEALKYAARLATQRHTPLVIVHVYENLFYGYGPLSVAGSKAIAAEQMYAAGEKLLEKLLAEVQTEYPGLEVRSILREGHPAWFLVEESRQAAVTIVGARGVGGFAGLMLGSVSTQVAAHSHGPVVVVRPGADPAAPILVAYDGSPAADAALAYAATEAMAQNLKLVVANAYWPEPWGFGHAPEGDPNELAREKGEQLIKDGIELIAKEHPGIHIEKRLIHSMGPEYSLVEESATASLTVVGCRGRGGFTGLLLGSVSRTLVTHAHSSVAVIHADH